MASTSPHAPVASGYRADIDGLRALAVLPVILFHARIPGFSGGFVGVDVFFVISGYLITDLLARELDRGRFSIAAFYERRIRRIFPALFAVLLASTLAAAWLFLPGEYLAYARSLAATVLFISNVGFWREAGYFDAGADEKPLLHTWSLGVEEQFYIVFPLLLFALHRWQRRSMIRWLSLLAIASFALSVYGVSRAPSATFYLAPARGCELLLGSLLALRAFPVLSGRRVREAAAAAGVAMILASVVSLRSGAPFPGWNALLPCVGAGLVILAGASGPSTIASILSSRPLVLIGLASYSLYLWHWPMLVFAQAYQVVELTFAQRVGVVLAAAAAGFASWRFVERPFRSRTGPEARPRLFAGAAVVMIAAMLVGVHGIRSGGWPTRLGPELLAIASYRDSSNADARRCFSWPQHRLAPEQSCDYGDAVPSSVALWGDSHANAVISTLGEVAKAHHTSVRFFGQAGCPALLGVDITHPDFRDCRQHNDAVFTALTSRPDITTVVLISRYAYYAKGPPQGLGTTAAGEMVVMLTDTTGSARDSISREAVVQRQFRATVDALERAGKRVAIIYPIPELGYAVPGSLARLVRVGRDPAALASPATYYRARHAFEIAVMDAAGRDGSVLRIYPEKALCDATRCRAVDGGRPLYVDENHLSVVGARLLVPQFEHIFDLR